MAVWMTVAFAASSQITAWADADAWAYQVLHHDLPGTAPDVPVYVNGEVRVGNLLVVHHRAGAAASWPAVLGLYTSGYLRLTPPSDPPTSFGTSAVLGPAYWEGGAYQHHPRLAEMRLNGDLHADDPLAIAAVGTAGKLAVEYDLTLWPPSESRMRCLVTQTAACTESFDLDGDRLAIHEGFKLAQLSSMYIDGVYHDSDAADYVAADGHRHADLADLAAGGVPAFLFGTPAPMDAAWLELAHYGRSSWQGATPSVSITLQDPGLAPSCTGQGYFEPTTDENDDNVGAWVHWDAAPPSWTAGDVHVVQYELAARDTPAMEVVDFPDPNLEAAIRAAIGKPLGQVHQVDLLNLTVLDAPDLAPSDDANDIVDLTGLEHCIDLQELGLQDHLIADLAPLVANAGLSSGDTVLLDGNSLDLSVGSSAYRDVETLRDRGATIACDNQTPTALFDALTSACTACYTPTNYEPGVSDPPHASISDDLQSLYGLGFRGIVTYGSDGVLADIPQLARGAGFDVVIQGVWDPTSQSERDAAAAAAAHVTAYCVGNEGLLRGDYTLQQVHDAMVWMREQTDRPVVTAEPWADYLSNAQLLDKCGPLVFATCHPLWAGYQAPGAGGTWTVNRYQELSAGIGSKLAWLKETGWASGDAPWCTEQNQRDFLSSLLDAGDSVRFCWFEAFDQPWKHEELRGYEVGPHWGLLTGGREPKLAAGLVSETHFVRIIEGPSGTPNPVASEGQVQCSVTAADSLGHDLLYQWTAEGDAGSFDDASKPSPIWTAPASTDSVALDCTLTVTVTCAQDPIVSASDTVTVTVLPAITLALAAGWNICTAGDPADETAILGDLIGPSVLAAYTWNCGQFCYEPVDLQNTSGGAVCGRGTWMLSSQDTNRVISLASPQQHTVNVGPGWNLLANPYGCALDLATALIPHGGQIILPAYTWNPEAFGYEQRTVIPAGCSFWTLCTWDGEATFDPAGIVPVDAASTVSSLVDAPEAANGDGCIQLAAVAAGITDTGTWLGTTSGDAVKTPKPPMMPGGVGAYLDVEDGIGYARSLVPEGENRVWTLTVNSPSGQECSLRIVDTSQLPGDMAMWLTDEATGERIDLRHAPGYTYTAREGRRQFAIELGERDDLLRVMSVSAQAAGEGAQISFTLSAAGAVTVDVLNIAGRTVRRIVTDRECDAGLQTVAWDGRCDSGTKAPGGMYLIRVTATALTGEQCRGLATMRLP
ncbi:MAG: FlgD immunoglobulin-like domain containing protein [Armatimonadota bacterium]|nr:FlgD immunoglobulin-like domain containing protein [Armatimonadota bacterium]